MRTARWTAALLAAATLGACGSSGSNPNRSGGSAPPPQGLILNPRAPAPPLTLTDYTGHRVDLSALRGRAVFVTFVYTRCPDVCPLIVASLASAVRQLGPGADRVRILAVTVDPRHDTPVAVRRFLAARGAVGRVDYLLAPARSLAGVWRRWKVGVTLGSGRRTVGHSSVIYGIDARGRMAIVYPADTPPGTLAGDVPRLLG